MGSSLTVSKLTVGRSDCSDLAVGRVYGSLWSSSSTEGLGSQSGESRSMGMARRRNRSGAVGAQKNGCGKSIKYDWLKVQ